MKVCYFANNTITPEGPVSLPDGSWLFVETKMSNIMWISADGKQRKIVANTAAPNGLAVDAQVIFMWQTPNNGRLFRLLRKEIEPFSPQERNRIRLCYQMTFVLEKTVCCI